MGGFACDGVSLDPTLQHKSSLVGNIAERQSELKRALGRSTTDVLRRLFLAPTRTKVGFVQKGVRNVFQAGSVRSGLIKC